MKMKKILLLLFVLGSFAFFQAQTTEVYPLPSSSEEKSISTQKSAEYPGGMMALRKDVADKINMNKIKGIKDTIVSKTIFTVNIKGKIENIIVTGDNAVFNKEIERALKSLKTKWKPAESNGMIVRSYYSFPATITFE